MGRRASAPRRPVPALQCYLAYGSALLAGVLTWRVLRIYQVFANPYWIGLVTSCMGTFVVWVFSIYDPYWVSAPPPLALAP